MRLRPACQGQQPALSSNKGVDNYFDRSGPVSRLGLASAFDFDCVAHLRAGVEILRCEGENTFGAHSENDLYANTTGSTWTQVGEGEFAEQGVVMDRSGITLDDTHDQIFLVVAVGGESHLALIGDRTIASEQAV